MICKGIIAACGGKDAFTSHIVRAGGANNLACKSILGSCA